MRFFLRTCVILCGFGCVLLAQEPDLPKPETQDPASPPSTTDGSLPSASPSPTPDLIPPDVLPPVERAASPAPTIPNLPTLPQLDEAFKQKPISATAGTAENHAQWRELKNQVVNHENVRAARRAADAARTDLQKRILLRQYYEIFYGEMIALATKPELKAYLIDRKKDQLNTLPQSRVRPTPTPIPSPSPAKPNH